MTAQAYLEYILCGTNVERAIVSGVPEEKIREWCRPALETLFGSTAREVLFSGYIAYVKRGTHGNRTK